MAIYYNTDQLPVFNTAVVTIGTFDGVHLGHQQILKEVVGHAVNAGGESIVITFEPHPRKLIFPDQPLKILTPLKQKLDLITDTGIKHIAVAPFTNEFSNLTATQYIEDFLVRHFHPSDIVIGYDHHFGHDRTGNIRLLRELEDVYNYRVHEIPAQLIDEATISSTKIRSALLQGQVDEAARMMGRFYSVSGLVRMGAQLGRTLGYPTANIAPTDPDQLIPANGVYAVRVKAKGTVYDGMLNIGFRPTVSEEKALKIEAHLIDFTGDLYNEELEVVFVQRLRSEEKFASIEDLRTQLNVDKSTAISVLRQR